MQDIIAIIVLALLFGFILYRQIKSGSCCSGNCQGCSKSKEQEKEKSSPCQCGCNKH